MDNLILNSLDIHKFESYELLLEVLPLLEEATQRLGGPTATNAWLLTPVSPALIAKLLGSRDKSRLSNLDAVAINFPDLLPGLKYLFFGRKELTNLLETIQIGPVNSPDKTLNITIGGFASYDTIDEQGPRFSIHMGKQSLVNFSLSSFTYPGLPLTELKGTTCILIQGGGLNRKQIGELWDGIALTTFEQEVLTALQLITPGTERINLVGDPSSARGRIPIVKIRNIDEPLPLHSLGDGMERMFSIALALVNARNGILLIDEIENGIYYSAQPDLWHLIFRIAGQLNVQVFATTHSWDCLKGFQEAAQEDSGEGTLIRLENNKDKILATLFDERQLGIATREQIEVR
jgi:hypothetical protein